MTRTTANKRYYETHKEEINKKRKLQLATRYCTDEEYRKSLCEKQKAYYYRKKLISKENLNQEINST